jgi:hypothetical protein
MSDERDDELVGRDEWGDEADRRLAEEKPSQAQATESPEQQAAPRTRSE